MSFSRNALLSLIFNQLAKPLSNTPALIVRLSLLAYVFVYAGCQVAYVKQAEKTYTSIEDFGGMAWYLPADGRLQNGIQYPLLDFTPAVLEPEMLKGLSYNGNHFTKITAKTVAHFFPEDIVGKSFCGLFAHQNPAKPDYNRVDEYYPQELGSRYARVVHRFDAQNVLVDFEYNGGGDIKARKIVNGKGYFFFDNSEAWDKMRKAMTDKENEVKEIRLQEFMINDGIQQLYVIPQYEVWQCTATDLKIWSGTKNMPALKIGYEDYYRLENRLGKTVVKQAENLFRLPGQEFDHNLIINIKLYPPHRTILEASTFLRTVFTWRKAAGVTALVGATQLDEERFIEAGEGLTEETFITWNFSSISAGGRLSSESKGVLQDVEAYGYVLCKDYEQRAPHFTQMNGHAGNYLVVENAYLDYEDQSELNQTSTLLKMRVNQNTNAYEGLPKPIENRKQFYLPYVFEVVGSGNLFKNAAMGGTNRTNLLTFNGSKGPYTFMASVQGMRHGASADLFGYWDMCFVPQDQRATWGMESREHEWYSKTPSKIMVLEEIPVKGRRYTISRHYAIKEKDHELTSSNNAQIVKINPDPAKAVNQEKKGFLYRNVVRTAVAWTTVLGKYGTDINPEADVPSNGKPLALQPGDQFRIPVYKGSSHDPKTVYTVTRKDRGEWPSFAAECPAIRNRNDWSYNFSNPHGYRYFWCELDKDLPESVGLTFEILMVESGSEELLDGKAREVWHTYKGIGKLGQNGIAKPNTRNAQGYGGYGQEDPFNSKQFSGGEALGHLCYSQVELTEWYKNVHWNNGFYRQNSNRGRGFEHFEIRTTEGGVIKVNPLARFSSGKTIINCTGGPAGEYSNKLNDFYMRDLILQSKGIELPEEQKAKLRIYNSPDVRTSGLKEPERFLEIYPTFENAPDMPEACKKVLEGLFHKDN
jgi:hypothetical protein